MSQNPATSPPSAQTKHRVRPTSNWKIPSIIGGILLIFGLGLGTGYILWGFPLSENRAELENVKAQLEVLKGEVQGAEDAASTSATAESAAADEIKQVTRYEI